MNELPYIAGFIAAAGGGASCGGVILRGVLPLLRQWIKDYGERTSETKRSNALLSEVRDAVNGLTQRVDSLERTVELAITARGISFTAIKETVSHG